MTNNKKFDFYVAVCENENCDCKLRLKKINARSNS